MPVARGRAGVKQEMSKFKAGTLHSGSKRGPVVTKRSQALAIALNEAGMSKMGDAAGMSMRKKGRKA